MNFFEELKRRNVIRVAIAYVVGAWLLVQGADLVFDLVGADDWLLRAVAVLLALGLIPVAAFAWAFEMTPEGIKKERDVIRDQSITRNTGRKLNIATMVLLLAAIGLLALDRMLPEQAAQVAVPQGPSTAASDAQELAADQPADVLPEDNSIAVLPFADLSETGDQEYFSDGIAEELLNLLVRVEGLKVASRTSSFAFKGGTQGIPEIAAELKVANILEGSVRKAGDRVRITAQLIDTRDDRHLWSDTFDRQLTDIFAIQDEIATAIVTALKEQLGVQAAAESIKVSAATENLDAYDLYLQGRTLFTAREDLAEAIRLFEQAIALDPGFARAWEGLAATERVARDWLMGDDIDHEQRAVQAAQRALELDPELSMPYAVMGGVAWTSDADNTGAGRFERAETLMGTAIEKDPKNTTAWLWRGLLYAHLGYFDKALADLDRCLDIDPAYLNCLQHRGRVLLHMGETEAALEILETTAYANFHSVDEIFVSTLVARGDSLAAALLAALTMNKVAPYAPSGDWVRALENPDADHREALARARRWAERNQVDLGEAAPQVLAAMGDYEGLSKSYTLAFIVWDPALAAFRQSPWFKAVVRRNGVEAYWRKHGFPPQCRSLGAGDFGCD